LYGIPSYAFRIVVRKNERNGVGAKHKSPEEGTWTKESFHGIPSYAFCMNIFKKEGKHYITRRGSLDERKFPRHSKLCILHDEHF
jgi:hypothetical protein